MVTWGDEEVRATGPWTWRGINRIACSGPGMTFWDKFQEKRSRERGKTNQQVPNPKRGVGMNLKLTKGCAGFRLASG